MKNEICQAFAAEIMTPEKPLSSAAEIHVAACQECARLRSDALRFAGTGVLEQEVPDELDRKILAHAAAFRVRRGHKKLLIRRWLPVCSAAAAAVVLCITLLRPDAEIAPAVPAGMAQEIAGLTLRNEWNAFEQEAFDLNQELTSFQSVAENEEFIL